MLSWTTLLSWEALLDHSLVWGDSVPMLFWIARDRVGFYRSLTPASPLILTVVR